MNNSKRIARMEAIAQSNVIEPLYMEIDGVQVDLRTLSVDELLALSTKLKRAEAEQEPTGMKHIDKLT